MSRVPTHRLAYSIPAAAEASDIGRSTIYEEIKNGALKSIKVGKRRLILPDDLAAWLQSKRTVAPGRAA